MAIVDTSGGFGFLPGSPFASGGVGASAKFGIERAVFHMPVPIEVGFDAISARLSGVDRPLDSLCGMEFQMPSALSVPEFIEFNARYLERLDAWGLLIEGRSPLARTNVAPTGFVGGESTIVAFSYTVPTDGSPSDFIVSGAPELPDGKHELTDVVRPGETSSDALVEKLQCVADVVIARAERLGRSWDDSTAARLYSVHDATYALQRQVLAERRISPVHGLTWYDAAPPVRGLEVEIDLRRCACEISIDRP